MANMKLSNPGALKLIILLILFVAPLIGCQKSDEKVVYDLDFIQSRNILCGVAISSGLNPSGSFLAQNLQPKIEPNHQRYLGAGYDSGLDLVLPNDNLTRSGILKRDLLKLDLEVKWGDFRMETPDRPGVKLVAIGETGKELTIPAPLVRVTSGTTIRARIKNTLRDSTITIYGLQKRPFTAKDSIFVMPGEVGEVVFDAGKPGTYMYWVKLGKGHKRVFGAEEDDQLAGAFIIDPKGSVVNDRVFVMNVFSNKNVDSTAYPEWVDVLTINGRSWPFTERMTPSVGDVLNWRIINASVRTHPMHLHGFYFDVLERGKIGDSNLFSEDQKKLVVTETMRGHSTMAMQWVPKRPGNWLFHCHLSFHVSSEIRLPGAEDLDPKDAHQHMAGLVIGIQVKDGPTDLYSKGELKKITLVTTDDLEGNMFINKENTIPQKAFQPGPLIVLKQFQTTNVLVKNEMSSPTSIHWHGLEIDSWSDGVPYWSSSDGRTSPAIEPGEEFEYKLSLMRPGTFVYHSHLDDIEQLSRGIYGPMIVIGEEEEYNPDVDHFYTMGWKSEFPQSPEDLDLNGWDSIPVQYAKTGETHRLRLINIAPAGGGRISMSIDDKPVLIKAVAKDGADLPLSQQIKVKSSNKIFVGETADYSFTPTEPGIYKLKFRYMMARWTQTWKVSDP